MMDNAIIDAMICVILGVLIVLVGIALGVGIPPAEPGLDTIPPPVYVVESTGQDG